MNAKPQRCWGILEEFTNRSFIFLILGESRGCPLARKKELFICKAHRPRTAKMLTSLLRSRRGAQPDTGAVTWPPSSGAAAWPTTLEEPGRKLHQATVLFHCTAQATSAGFLLCRQDAKCARLASSGTHPKSLSEMGGGTCCAEWQGES